MQMEGQDTMAEPYLGQVIAVGFDFAPRGWYSCNGQTLPIAQNQALFALLGTTYGGNGTTTFAVPNLCGRAGVGVGQGAGGSNYVPGEMTGTEQVILLATQTATHTHPLMASGQTATTATPSAATALATSAFTAVSMYGTTAATTTLSPGSVGTTGGSTPHENRQPYQVINYIICAQGIFPSRS